VSEDPYDSFASETTVFWHEHGFQPGAGGTTELLWVQFRTRAFSIQRLESHRLTEQAIVPVTGDAMIHVVCPPPSDPEAPDIIPDLDQVKAFLLDGSKGVCMKRGCWHAHFPLTNPATYLMITRRSTTQDILRAEYRGSSTTETITCDIDALTDTAFELVL
jgi:ureidoglycolate lyase